MMNLPHAHDYTPVRLLFLFVIYSELVLACTNDEFGTHFMLSMQGPIGFELELNNNSITGYIQPGTVLGPRVPM